MERRRAVSHAIAGLVVIALSARAELGRAATCSTAPAWSSYSPSTSPSARWHASMVWDAANARTILFGGRNSSGTSLNDVWSFSPATGAWTQLSPSGTAPAVRYMHAAIYDSYRQRMVVFGGVHSGSDGPYALSLSGSPAWSSISTSGSPPNTPHGVGIYDTPRDRLVYHQTDGSTYVLTFSTNAWTNPVSYGPTLAEGWSGAYDPVNQRLLIHGGWDAATGGCTIAVFQELWELPLNPIGSWHSLGTSGPRLAFSTMVFDPQWSRMVLFGGTTSMGCPSSCLGGASDAGVTNAVYSISLTGTLAWTQHSPTGTAPTARSRHVAAFDPARNEVIVFGGGTNGSTCTYLNDTKALTLPDVTPPSAITDLSASAGCISVHLTWTAPGDDGTTYRAAAYELIRSTTPGGYGSVVASPTPGTPGTTEETWDEVGGCSPSYYYRISALDEANNSGAAGNNAAAGQTYCGSHGCFDEAFPMPLVSVTSGITRAEPNPARDRLRFQYAVAPADAGASAQLGVYDLAGRRLVALASGPASSGTHDLEWDLRSESGARVEGGMYFLRLRLGNRTYTRTIVAAR